MGPLKQIFIFSMLFLFIPLYIKADKKLRLSDIFSDNMVLQRDAEIVIYGYGKPNKEVMIDFIDENATVKINSQGEWQAKLKPRQPGGPYQMKISSANEKIILKNILIGDVWFCSGQSNMEWQLMHSKDGEEELKNFIENDKIRFFIQGQIPSPYPLKDASGSWLTCNKENAQTFSAIAYFFGKKMYGETRIPVGLINSSWGGTPIEIWLDAKMMKGNQITESILKRWNFSKFDWKKWNYGKGMDYKIEISELKFIPKVVDKKSLVVKFCENCVGDIGGSWYSFAKPGSFTEFKSENGKGIIQGTIGFNAWAGAGTLLNSNSSPFDLSDYEFIELNVSGNGKFSLALCQPGIEDYDFYSSEDFEATSLPKYLRIPISSFKQGGWGIAKPFTQNAIKQLQFNIKSITVELPSVLYNGMVHPFANFKIKGVLWYQGESNAEKAKQYETLLPLMIKNWRDTWGYEIPFFIVQLPNFLPEKNEPSESAWAELREAQLKAMLNLPKVVTVPIIDLGDEKDIHPKIKRPVGERLANAALVLLYDKNGVLTGPLYESMEIKENKIYIKFRYTGSGLVSKNGELKGFAIAAGTDKKFKWAKAEIKDKDTVVVWNDEIKEPYAVRYAWADSPECNLYNKEGLPALPFRTDNFKGITEDNY